MSAEPDSLWAGLAKTGAGGLVGRRAAALPPSAPVYVAVDAAGARYLLVRVDQAAPSASSRTRALHVYVEVLSVSALPEERYLVLCCREEPFFPLFDRLVQQVLEAIRAMPDEAWTATLRTVERWRRFWAVDPGAMSEEKALGLFGELWFLLQWVKQVNAETLGSWQGPAGAPHDFQWRSASVEVKVTASRRVPVSHRISSLEQLDEPSSGDLYLFSLQVMEDELGSNSLPRLVEAARQCVQGDPVLLDLLDERLAEAHYTPAADARFGRAYRILSEELYRVEHDFPRLVHGSFPGGLPAGIGNITYDLSMGACAAFCVATSPDAATAILDRIVR